MQRRSLIPWVVLFVLATPALPATAAIDMTGPWHLRLQSSSPPAVLDQINDFLQMGTSLSMSLGVTTLFTGTIDPDTGEFSMVPTTATCGPSFFSGTADAGGTSFVGFSTTYTFIDQTCFQIDFNILGTLCGNGVLDAGEQCDDRNVNNGDCCSSTCQLDPAGSACSDGNPCTDDGCDGVGTCEGVANTAPCNDNLFCNGADTCSGGACTEHAGDPCVGGPECADTCAEGDDRCYGPYFDPCTSDGNECTLDRCDVDGSGTGFCAHIPLPATQGDCGPCKLCDAAGGCAAAPIASSLCKVPAASLAASLTVRNRTPNTGDRLVWKWRQGEATMLDEFGDPANTDGYALCAFDESGVTPSVVFRAEMPAGDSCGSKPCWKDIDNGFAYRDAGTSPNGILAMRLRAGASGEARISIVGQGDDLMLGTPAALPLPLRVQLQATHGGCWEATFDAALVNDGERFKASGD